MTWTYEDQPFTELPEGVFGFVYCITYTSGEHYIGKKQCISETRLPALKDGTIRPNSYRIGRSVALTKKELEVRTPTQVRTNVKNKIVQFDVVRKESAWKKYTGSSKLTVGKTIALKTILQLAYSKRQLTYLETKYLFLYEAIERDDFINENIMAKFFRGNIS